MRRRIARPWRPAAQDKAYAAMTDVGQAVKASLHLLDDLVDAEARWSLARRILLKGCQELADQRLYCEADRPGVPYHPVVVAVRRDVGPLIRVRLQVEHLGQAQSRERLGPDAQVPVARCSSNSQPSSFHSIRQGFHSIRHGLDRRGSWCSAPPHHQ
jgi:hypothetical protein